MANIIAQRKYLILLVALGLILLASIPRLYNLGALSFYGDEETTSLPSLALSNGQGSIMPSGMPYLRALPHSWLNSLGVKIFGQKNEFSYRIIAAVFGILTIPLFFLLTRPFFGTKIAFLAALLLAVSDWHIITSREARMYAPFLFFYMTTAFYITKWVTSGGILNLCISAVLFALTISMHALGIFAILFFLVPILLKGEIKTKPWQIILVTIAFAALAHTYSSEFINATYDEWKSVAGTPVTVSDESDVSGNSLPMTYLPVYILISLSLLGIFLGAWVGRCCQTVGDISNGYRLRLLNHYGLAILTAIAASFGFIYAALLFGYLFSVSQRFALKDLLKKCNKPLITIVILIFCWVVYAIMGSGFKEGLKHILYFPFPYLLYFFKVFPLMMVIALGALIKIAMNPSNSDNQPYIICAFAVILPLLAVGLASPWEGFRYFIEIYPFILILMALGLYFVISKSIFVKSKYRKLYINGVSIVIILSGAIGGHGLPQAWRIMNLKHGEQMEAMTFGFQVYPDHKSAGQYVKERLRTDDIVVAEDALQQYWYIGKVDYWLRDSKTHYAFLYQSQNNEIRDIYVNSQIINDRILQNILDDKSRRVWVVTSAETYHKRELYLSETQLKFLDNIKKSPGNVYIAEDGITSVYCLHCDSIDNIK